MKSGKKPGMLLIFFTVLLGGCQFSSSQRFAIYLLAEDISAVEFSKMDLNSVNLESTPMISSQDMLSYDANSHIIELTPEAYQRFQDQFPMPVKVSGIPFVVCVGSKRIYAGGLWTPLSSISFDGVVIMQPFDESAASIQLVLGYPSPAAFSGVDPRMDARIFSALEELNKLK